jgi:cytoskeleton protein RodZ
VDRGLDIGRGLREERERLGLSLRQAEADTRIRARYLAALEDEQFDELPGEAYVRGFLRSYAAYLGLDGARYVAAYRARVQAPEPAIAPRPVAVHPPRRAAPLLLALAVALAAAVALGAWQLDDGRDDEVPPRPPTPTHPESIVTAPQPAAEPAPAPPPRPAPAPRRAPPPTALVLTARGGNCWLDVRIGGPAGRQAWTGTLQQGRTLRLGLSRPLFIRAGAPHNLHATIGGRVQPLRPGVFDLVATREGVRPRR